MIVDRPGVGAYEFYPVCPYPFDILDTGYVAFNLDTGYVAFNLAGAEAGVNSRRFRPVCAYRASSRATSLARLVGRSACDACAVGEGGEPAGITFISCHEAMLASGIQLWRFGALSVSVYENPGVQSLNLGCCL